MAYYLAKVEVRMENDRGRIQKIRELYCVEAESVTEAIMNQLFLKKMNGCLFMILFKKN